MTFERIGLLLVLAVALPLSRAAAQDLGGVQQTDEGVLLDFQEADLRLVIAALAEAAGLNVVYSELPARRVTLRMARPVPRESLPGILKSIAESNGLTVTEGEAFLRLESSLPRERANDPQEATEQQPEAELRLYVYRLKHAKAARLAGTLQSIFGGARSAASDRGISRPSLSEGLEAQRIPPVAPGEPEVTVDVGEVRPSLPGELSGEVQIVPDEATNSLLVRARPADWEVVEQAIQALDLRPLQVLIEVLIAEVRRTSDFDLGVSVEGSDGDDDADGDGSRVSGALESSAAGDFSLRIQRLGGLDMDLALSALSARGAVRILSRPVILAQNNQEARIMIGAERPFIQVFRSLPTDAAIRDQIVQYRDVGTSLTILPTINPDGGVNLQVVQEVSTATSETQFGAPVISTREASTHLFVGDGETAVIGGLIDRQQDRSESGIPVLRDIPILGALFGSTRNTTIRSELFLFLTPHVIASGQDADRIRGALESGAELMREELPFPQPLIPPRRTEPPDTIPGEPGGSGLVHGPSGASLGLWTNGLLQP